MRMLPGALLVALSMLAAASPAVAAPGDDVFVERTLVHDGARRAYRVFVPRGNGPGPRPVILFLHGSGERGSDNLKQTAVGFGPAVIARRDAFPAIVVFPQATEESRWAGAEGDVAMAALDAAIGEFGGDPARVYLTGMSRGGYGVFELALAHPARFAALVPVCGGLRAPPHRADLYVEALKDGPDPHAELAARLGDVPMWLFHGAKDDVVPPENSRQVVGALVGAGAAPRYTEFPDANHNAWDAAYGHAPMWEWLFAQRRENRSGI